MELDAPLYGLAAIASAIPIGILFSRGTSRLDRMLFAGFVGTLGLTSLFGIPLHLESYSSLHPYLTVAFNASLLCSACLALFSTISLRREIDGQDLVLAFPVILVVLYSFIVPIQESNLPGTQLHMTMTLLVVSLACYLSLMGAAVYNLIWVYHHMDTGPQQERMLVVLLGLTILTGAELVTAFEAFMGLEAPAFRPVGIVLCAIMVTHAFTSNNSK